MASRAWLVALITGSAACGAPSDAGNDGSTGARSHAIGGRVIGLASSAVVLRNNGGDDLEVPAGASTFTFAARVADGGAYEVTVLAQPAAPADSCSVTRGAGVATAEVTDIVVLCGPPFTRVAVGPGLGNATLARGSFDLLPLLSQTGVFTNLAELTPHAALVPYAVNAQLWSDNAAKARWIAVPSDGPPFGAAEQVTFSAAGLWSFPAGTVTVKHFELVVDETTGARKRLETRVGVLLSNGTFAGASYRWRADRSDADLVTTAIDEINTVTTAGGSSARTHTYPGTAMCPTCHVPTAGFGLGLRTAQLNGDLLYPGGAMENQLRAWGRAKLLGAAFVEAELPTFLRTVAITDAAASLEARARSYFEGNCSGCHHPGGPNTTWDARFSTPLPQQNLIGSAVRARDPAGSPLYQRMGYAAVDTPGDKNRMMPPLTKNHVDRYALQIVEQWILSLP